MPEKTKASNTAPKGTASKAVLSQDRGSTPVCRSGPVTAAIRTAILKFPAACCPGALHTAVCKQAFSQRPVFSAQTMRRYSARINAFILLQLYYNSRRSVSQAFDSLSRLCYTGQKHRPEVFCHAAPHRTPFPHPPASGRDARPSGPHHRPGACPALHRYAGSFTDPPRPVGLVHRMGSLPERLRRLGGRPLLQRPARKWPSRDRLRPPAGVRASGLCHRGRPRRLPLGLRPARRHRRRGRDRPRQHRLAGCPPPSGIRAHGNDGRGRAEVYSAQKGRTALQNQRFPLYISPDLCHNLLY